MAMLKEDRGIVAAKCGAQQPDCILCVRGKCHLPADCVCPQHFTGHTVPRIADLCKAAGHSHYDRSSESVRGSPSDCAAVVELLRCRVCVLPELNLRDGH